MIDADMVKQLRGAAEFKLQMCDHKVPREWIFENLVAARIEELTKQLERLADAEADVKRLHTDKMNLWESINFPGGYKAQLAAAEADKLDAQRWRDALGNLALLFAGWKQALDEGRGTTREGVIDRVEMASSLVTRAIDLPTSG